MLIIDQITFNKINQVAEESNNSSFLFNFEFKELRVRCIYLGQGKTILVGFPDRNCAWNIDIGNMKLSESIPYEAYRLIRDMLKTDSEKATNKDFFIALKGALGSISKDNIQEVTKNEIIEQLWHTKTKDRKYDKEGEKPFFKHWRRVKPSSESLTKIQKYFGNDVRQRCYQDKVTGVWSDIPVEKSLLFLNTDEVNHSIDIILC